MEAGAYALLSIMQCLNDQITLFDTLLAKFQDTLEAIIYQGHKHTLYITLSISFVNLNNVKHILFSKF